MNQPNEQNLRHELKYRIDYLQYQMLRKKLSLVLKPDPHTGPDNSYQIRNLYFDDFRNAALDEKLSGWRTAKYRLRIYNHSDAVVKFERKKSQPVHFQREC